MSDLTNQAEARALLVRKVAEVKALGYKALRERLGEWRFKFLGVDFYTGGAPHTSEEAAGGSGIAYLFEIEVDEDWEPDRVVVDVFLHEPATNGVISAGFVIAGDGSLVDEWL